MRRHCHNCKSFLKAWETRCACCRTPAMRWLHLFAVAAVPLTFVFYLFMTAR
jgi:hypothetical protein